MSPNPEDPYYEALKRFYADLDAMKDMPDPEDSSDDEPFDNTTVLNRHYPDKGRCVMFHGPPDSVQSFKEAPSFTVHPSIPKYALQDRISHFIDVCSWSISARRLITVSESLN